MPIQHITVPSKIDNFPLSASVFFPESIDNGNIILLSNATGVPAKHYWKFAEYLSSHKFIAMTWDYRLSGASFPSGVKSRDEKRALLKDNQQVDLVTYALRDYLAIQNYIYNTYPTKEFTLIGNSLGGHMLAFTTIPMKRAILLNTFNPHYSIQEDPEQMQNEIFGTRVYTLTKELGFFPSREEGRGNDDIPAGVFLQWGFFSCNPESDLYNSVHADLQPYYKNFSHPNILSIRLTDDPFASDTTIDHFIAIFAKYSDASRFSRLTLDPESLNWGENGMFGHVNFFRNSGGWDWFVKNLLVEKGLPHGKGVSIRHFNGGADGEYKASVKSKL